MVVLRKMRQKDRGNRPHPRGADQSGFAAFEPGHLLGKLDCVGMPVAGVDEARGAPLAECVHVVEISRAVDDAQIDRRNERPATRASAIQARVHRESPDAECSGRWHGSPVGIDKVSDKTAWSLPSCESTERPRPEAS